MTSNIKYFFPFLFLLILSACEGDFFARKDKGQERGNELKQEKFSLLLKEILRGNNEKDLLQKMDQMGKRKLVIKMNEDIFPEKSLGHQMQRCQKMKLFKAIAIGEKEVSYERKEPKPLIDVDLVKKYIQTVLGGASKPKKESLPLSFLSPWHGEVLVIMSDSHGNVLWRSAKGDNFHDALYLASRDARDRWIQRFSKGEKEFSFKNIEIQFSLLERSGFYIDKRKEKIQRTMFEGFLPAFRASKYWRYLLPRELNKTKTPFDLLFEKNHIEDGYQRDDLMLYRLEMIQYE